MTDKTTTTQTKQTAKDATATAAETTKQAAESTAQTASEASETFKGAADVFATNAFDMPNVFRDFAEKGMTRARANYDTYKSLAEEATDAVEDALTTANKNAGEIQRQALISAKTQMNANFDFAEKMLKVKTFSEALELQSSFMRQQFDTMQSNIKEFQTLSSRLQQETAKPFTQNLGKVMEQWRASA
ncbi:phasin [Lutibaculum baratangense]|uniref:Phasin domain-containing protein n=1 Tax=Lutibaculum baratangense AMV1 TaxID=631454 RepID=V4RKB6_9HYPH|nr:phasin [Lutibaculum baratangense]ESR23700.1 hypothetical protein N177_2930 [Lutibaculum baratangense AMV1]